jgi:hypothetical protein
MVSDEVHLLVVISSYRQWNWNLYCTVGANHQMLKMAAAEHATEHQ